MDDKYIPEHKRLAMGMGLLDGDFGVDKLSSHAAGGPGSGNKMLGDHERGARPPIGGNQANPDHGY